jgi:Sperm-tail PG-rich repeat
MARKYLEKQNFLLAEPGPGSYNVPLSTIKLVKKTANSPPIINKQSERKDKSPQSQTIINQVPGPGYYNILNKFITSKHPSLGNVKLAPQIL